MDELLQERWAFLSLILARQTGSKTSEFVPYMLARRHSLIPIKVEKGKFYSHSPFDFAAEDVAGGPDGCRSCHFLWWFDYKRHLPSV